MLEPSADAGRRRTDGTDRAGHPASVEASAGCLVPPDLTVVQGHRRWLETKLPTRARGGAPRRQRSLATWSSLANFTVLKPQAWDRSDRHGCPTRAPRSCSGLRSESHVRGCYGSSVRTVYDRSVTALGPACGRCCRRMIGRASSLRAQSRRMARGWLSHSAARRLRRRSNQTALRARGSGPSRI